MIESSILDLRELLLIGARCYSVDVLAWIDYSIPKLVNERTAVLFGAFTVMALLITPFSPLKSRTKERLAVLYAPAILVWWYFFQFELVSLRPGIHYYLGKTGQFSWAMNSAICYAFGLAFSVRLWRLSRGYHQFFGKVFTMLFLFLIVSGRPWGPPIQST